MITGHNILFGVQWLFAAVGIIGNIWVIVAIVRHNAIKRYTNKILFINLAIADMGVLLVRNPFFFLSYYFNNRWLFGELTCKILMPLSLIFMPASVLTLVAISYSRCRAVVNVRQLKDLSTREIWYIVVFIWAFVLAFYPIIEIPVRKVNETAETCYMDISLSVSYILYGFEDFYFAISFVVIIVMFIRMRRSLLDFPKVYSDLAEVKGLMQNMKALKLLWPVVVVLFVTMIPFMIVRTWIWVEVIIKTDEIPMLISHIIDILLITNSAVNPFIYIIVSTKFRRRILQIPCVRVFRNLWLKSRPRNLPDNTLFEINDIHETNV